MEVFNSSSSSYISYQQRCSDKDNNGLDVWGSSASNVEKRHAGERITSFSAVAETKTNQKLKVQNDKNKNFDTCSTAAADDDDDDDDDDDNDDNDDNDDVDDDDDDDDELLSQILTLTRYKLRNTYKLLRCRCERLVGTCARWPSWSWLASPGVKTSRKSLTLTAMRSRCRGSTSSTWPTRPKTATTFLTSRSTRSSIFISW